MAASPPLVQAITTNRLLFWGLLSAQVGLVFVLSARVQQLSASTASLLFILYSAWTGVTISFALPVPELARGERPLRCCESEEHSEISVG